MTCRNPWKKKHLTQRPSPAHPLLTYAQDRELDIAVQRLIHVEDTIRKLTKEMKKYVESVINLDRADEKLTLNLINCGLAQINEEFRNVVEEYHSVTAQVGKTVQEIEPLLNKTFIEPLKKLRDQFALIETALVKREELVAIWKTSYNRVKKLEEKRDKSGSHVAKLERERRAEEVAAKELKAAHTQLLTELPSFLEKRLEYIKPCVQAFIMIQLDYYGTATQLFTQLMPNAGSLGSPSRNMIPEAEYQETLNKEFSRIKGLTIIKDHSRKQ